MTHTPTPWKLLTHPYKGHKPERNGTSFLGEIIGADGTKIYAGPFSFHSLIGQENAQLIVTAVNTHTDLLEALSDIYGLTIGYDGFDTVEGLKSLIDDIRRIAENRAPLREKE
jgi:hypothetical protein